ncbi:2910_t:CDS:2 [Acaulospora morrowiae]|uniref:2910_t:CDS:1 n=1 Tax=Acaulospora morrowiae TaxID=94023 RepID=A0A9N8Z3T6_9GLOM|nr:2910_t:CDS:2 [Acaulospora morrowiae]
MVGYGPPTFSGRAGEDPEDFIREFKRYILASRIDITNLDNILDNTGTATITAFRALNNGALTGINANQFRGQALVVRNNTGGDNTIMGANIIPAGVWDKDWSIAGGHPAPAGTAVVAPNVNGGGNANVVLPGMTIGQKLYELRYNYITTNALKQSAMFGTIVQGTMSVQQFVSKLQRIGKLARMTPEQIREQWLRELSPMNQYTLRSSGMFFQTMDNQLRNLAELEAYTFSQNNASQQQNWQGQNPISEKLPIKFTPTSASHPRQRKATGVAEFTIDENGNPISRARPKKIPPKVPSKAMEEILAYNQLKLIQDAGYSDFDEFFKARDNYFRSKACLSNKPQVSPKPKTLTKIQQKQIDIQNSEMLSDMASRWSLNDPVSNLAEYNEDNYEDDEDNSCEYNKNEIENGEEYYDDNNSAFYENNYENFAYNAEKSPRTNSRYSPIKKKLIHGSISTTSSNQSLKPAVSASLANKAVAGMTTQIHITDLLKMVSPAMRIELRKAFIEKEDTLSEPMQIANFTEQGFKISQATVAYIAGDIDGVKFDKGILDTGSNIDLIDGDFFDSLGFVIDQKARYMIKGAGMKTLPIGKKKGIPVTIGNVTNEGNFLVIKNLGHPIVLGMPWIKQVGGIIDTNKD